MTLELRAAAYFHDPREFLLAFARDPADAIARLEADPKAFGRRHIALSIYGRERAYKSLLAAARKAAKLGLPSTAHTGSKNSSL